MTTTRVATCLAETDRVFRARQLELGCLPFLMLRPAEALRWRDLLVMLPIMLVLVLLKILIIGLRDVPVILLA